MYNNPLKYFIVLIMTLKGRGIHNLKAISDIQYDETYRSNNSGMLVALFIKYINTLYVYTYSFSL